MGGCVSAHRDPESAMRFRLSFGSKTDKLVIPSPIKDKPIINSDRPIADAKVGLKPQWSPSPQSVTGFRDFGSKEETFFDSQAWLDSDCEDDFLSVNGDFTPSRGSTPVHHVFSKVTPQVDIAVFEDGTPGSKPEPSPKRRLSELFEDSLRSDRDIDLQSILGDQNEGNGKMEAKATSLDLFPKSANGAPFVAGGNSVWGGETTPHGDFRPRREKSGRSAQCCLPSLLPSRRFSERKNTSPARSIG